MKIQLKALLSCGAAAIALAAGQAWAADDVAEEAETVEAVVITAAPVARGNTIVTADAIAAQPAAMNIINAIQDVPGVAIRGSDAFNADPWTYGVNIRGFDINLRSSKIGQTIDGMPAYNASYYLGGAPAQKYLMSENVERIQIDQGTTGVGSASASALGGTIAYITRDPKEEAGGLVAITFGDNEARRYAGVYDTGRVLGDTTRAYVGLARFTACRWVYGCSDGSGFDEWHVEAKSVTELDKLTITARISYDDAVDDPLIEASRSFLDGTTAGDASVPAWTSTPAGVNENWAHAWSAHRENTLAYVKFDYALSDAVQFEVAPYFHHQKGQGDWAPPYQQIAIGPDGVRTIAGGTAAGSSRKRAYYGWTDASGRQRAVVQGLDYTDVDGTRITSSLCYGAGGAVSASCVPLQTYRTSLYSHDRYGFTSKARFEFGQHRVEAGVWYEKLDRDFGRAWRQIVDVRKGPDYYTAPQLIDFMQHFSTDQWKLYVEDVWTLGDLTLTGGLQKYLIEIDGETEGWDAYGKSTAPLRTSLNADSDVLFSLSALYRVNENLQVFGGFSQNYGAAGDWALEKTQTDTSKLKSSVADDFEAGLRFHGRRFSAQVTAYYINYKNAITFYSADFITGGPSGSNGGINYTAGTSGAYANTGKGIESKGVEASFVYDLSEAFKLSGALTLNDSTYQEAFTGGTANAGSVKPVAKGNEVPGAPTTLVSLGLDYRRDNFRAGVRAKHTGKTAGDAPNTPSLYLPAYTIVDLSAGYRLPLENGRAVDFQVNVTNLLDEGYIGGMLDEFTQRYTRGAPRTVSAGLSFSF
ncbi:TonB-dependent receptor domain-containing protein [Caulobacter mirabilis]|nr:TonB-dependent receptor [Caulobacter mirabilis]